MDIVSHGLWGGTSFGRKSKKNFWTAFFWAVFPDLFSFGIFTISTLSGFEKGPDWKSGPPDPSLIPPYVHTLYDFTHSLIPFAIIFFTVWFIRKKPYYLMLGWPLHIIFDIGTHGTEFFPTPFLWPFSSYRFDGVSWSSPEIFFPNLFFLGFLYVGWLLVHRYKKNN